MDILVGADETKLFPIEKDRFNHKGAELILYQSVLTGNHLLYGKSTEIGAGHATVQRLVVKPKVDVAMDCALENGFANMNDFDGMDVFNRKEANMNIKAKSKERISEGHKKSLPSKNRGGPKKLAQDPMAQALCALKTLDLAKIEKENSVRKEEVLEKSTNVGTKIYREKSCTSAKEDQQNMETQQSSAICTADYKPKTIVIIGQNSEKVGSNSTVRKIVLSEKSMMESTEITRSSPQNNKTHGATMFRMQAIDKLEEVFKEQCTAEILHAESDKEHEKRKRAEEENQICKEMVYCEETKKWLVSYIYNAILKNLEDNYNLTKKRMISLNKKLEKSQEICEVVNVEINKNIQRKYWQLSSDLKLDSNLQRHYLPINYMKSHNST